MIRLLGLVAVVAFGIGMAFLARRRVDRRSRMWRLARSAWRRASVWRLGSSGCCAGRAVGGRRSLALAVPLAHAVIVMRVAVRGRSLCGLVRASDGVGLWVVSTVVADGSLGLPVGIVRRTAIPFVAAGVVLSPSISLAADTVLTDIGDCGGIAESRRDDLGSSAGGGASGSSSGIPRVAGGGLSRSQSERRRDGEERLEHHLDLRR